MIVEVVTHRQFAFLSSEDVKSSIYNPHKTAS